MKYISPLTDADAWLDTYNKLSQEDHKPALESDDEAFERWIMHESGYQPNAWNLIDAARKGWNARARLDGERK